jgi:hypothetical protein
VITADAMFDPLLRACPSFRPVWEAFVEEWREDDAGLPRYVALGELARHLISLLRAGDDNEANGVLTVVEAWHAHGDDYVREAATIGFLEALGHNLEHSGIEVDHVVSMLGPQSRRWWDKLERYWSGDTDALAEGEAGAVRSPDP